MFIHLTMQVKYQEEQQQEKNTKIKYTYIIKNNLFKLAKCASTMDRRMCYYNCYIVFVFVMQNLIT